MPPVGIPLVLASHRARRTIRPSGVSSTGPDRSVSSSAALALAPEQPTAYSLPSLRRSLPAKWPTAASDVASPSDSPSHVAPS